MLDATHSRALLDYLIASAPGELRFIRSDENTKYQRPGQAVGEDAWDPAYWNQEDVVSVEQHPAKPHFVMAFTAAGSACVGTPEAVLSKLSEWKYYDPAQPAATGPRIAAALEAKYEVLKVTKQL